jgi:spermidine synthase
MLSRILGNTVFATSTVLAAFMAGLALGSYLVGRFIDRSRAPLAWYVALEVGIGLSALLSLVLPDGLLPLYQATYRLAGDSRAWLSAAQGVLALAFLLIPTTLMGATLPTLCAFGSRRHEGFGKCVATLYASNTLGAVTGVIASGFVLIGTVGESNTIGIGVVLNILVAGAALLVGWVSRGPQPISGGRSERGERATGEEEARSREEKPQPLPSYPAHVRRVVLWCFAASGFAALANEVIWTRMLMLHLGTSTYAFSAMLAALLLGTALGSSRAGQWIDRWPDPLRTLAHL